MSRRTLTWRCLLCVLRYWSNKDAGLVSWRDPQVLLSRLETAGASAGGDAEEAAGGAGGVGGKDDDSIVFVPRAVERGEEETSSQASSLPFVPRVHQAASKAKRGVAGKDLEDELGREGSGEDLIEGEEEGVRDSFSRKKKSKKSAAAGVTTTE